MAREDQVRIGRHQLLVAYGMLLLTIPVWLATRALATLVPTVIAVAAILLARQGDYTPLAATGVLNAVVLGVTAGYLFAFMGFASSDREMAKVLGGIIVPCALSAVAGILLVVLALAAR